MTENIPTIMQCMRYIVQYEMLDNIREHSFMVARVAKTLVDNLGEGTTLPPEDKVVAGALLHDIAKTRCLNNNVHHARDGQNICNELGHPEIGEIVVEHVVLKNFNEPLYQRGVFSAREIVYYADKRVRHDQVVSLDDRLAYIIERYAGGNAENERRIRLNFAATKTLEKYLFARLDFSAEELSNRLVEDAFTPVLNSILR